MLIRMSPLHCSQLTFSQQWGVYIFLITPVLVFSFHSQSGWFMDSFWGLCSVNNLATISYVDRLQGLVTSLIKRPPWMQRRTLPGFSRNISSASWQAILSSSTAAPKNIWNSTPLLLPICIACGVLNLASLIKHVVIQRTNSVAQRCRQT